MSDSPDRFKGPALTDRCNSGTQLHPRKTDGETYGFSGAFDINLPQVAVGGAGLSNGDAIRRWCSPRIQEDTA